MGRVVIVGAGFGGLAAVKTLIKKRPNSVKITLIDQKNHHLFQPLLYQVATAGLSPADIAVPVRSLIQAGREDIEVLMDRVLAVDTTTQKLNLASGSVVAYDALILAMGATHSYFGQEHWEEHAPGLKTLEQATEIRRRILSAFELAEASLDQALRRELLTFVVVGAGPTGVELAGSIAEISRQTMAKDFSRIDPASTRIILIEAGQQILASFHPDLARRAMRALEKLGVTVWTSMRVTGITARGVQLGSEFVAARTVLWAAGVRAAPLAAQLGVAVDQQGRVPVLGTLQIASSPRVFAIGDMARFSDAKYGVLPGLAPVAMQQGRLAASNALALIAGQSLQEFSYLDKGQMATIGRSKAVSEFRGIRMSGLLAWLAWLFVHIYYLVGFRSKLFVILQWLGSYVTFKRGARLITGGDWRLWTAANASSSPRQP